MPHERDERLVVDYHAFSHEAMIDAAPLADGRCVSRLPVILLHPITVNTSYGRTVNCPITYLGGHPAL